MDKNKLKVAYFGRTISVSETFISQLLFGLNHSCHLTFINGYDRPANYNGVQEINTGIKTKLPILENKFLGKLLRSFMPEYINIIIGQRRIQKLKRTLDPILFNIAYTDYGINAIQILPYLKERKIPLIVHFHGYDITSELNDTNYRKNLIVVFKYASKIVAASHHIKRLLVIEGCSIEKITVIRYGISLPNNVSPTPWNIKFQSNPAISFVGRLVEKKNPIALIEAFSIAQKKHKNAILHIIGDGYLKELCIKRINDLGLKNNVVMHGALQHEDIFNHLKDSWLYAQHSVTGLNGDQEGFAISPAEAALMEIPVLSTYHNGIPEHVLDNKTGLLCKEYDYENMGRQMIFLLDNKNEMIKLGKAGRKNILEMCNPEKRIHQFMELLQNNMNA